MKLKIMNVYEKVNQRKGIDKESLRINGLKEYHYKGVVFTFPKELLYELINPIMEKRFAEII